MQDYSKYYLKDNPFPENPLVDPYSTDIRTNGEIFCEAVSKNELSSLSAKLVSKVNLVYVSGYKFERGIGKSALMVHEWKRLTQAPETTSVYVRCKKGDKPSDFCGNVISRWHGGNYLWISLGKLLTKYSKESQDLRLTPESVETMFGSYRNPPDNVQLALYTHYTSADALAKNFSKWLSETSGVSLELAYNWSFCYLSSPGDIISDFCGPKARRVDKIEFFGELLKVLAMAGFNEHYIFLDQLEDVIMAVSANKVVDFSLDMRRILEKASGKAVLVCTLHPDSEVRLGTEAGKRLTSLAPLDTLHRVDVIELKTSGDEAPLLAAEYLKRFRTAEAPTDTYPFDPEALRYVCFLKRGNKREFLAILCSCLKHGALLGAKEISLGFLLQYPRETIGQITDEEALKRFREGEVRHV